MTARPSWKAKPEGQARGENDLEKFQREAKLP
jgi:hypothetical protein